MSKPTDTCVHCGRPTVDCLTCNVCGVLSPPLRTIYCKRCGQAVAKMTADRIRNQLNPIFCPRCDLNATPR